MAISAFRQQTALTVLLLLLTLLLFELTDADRMFEHLLYNTVSHQWLLDAHNALLKGIFYDGIKRLLILAALLLAALLVFSRRSPWVERYRRPLKILLLSLLVVPSVVGALKAVTDMPCPRNFADFGGELPYFKLLQHHLTGAEHFACFPAGHASGGFALLALVFFFAGKWQQWLAAVAPLTVGWVMGLYKMAIGHHFLSHTIISMLLAWLLILYIARFTYHGLPDISVVWRRTRC